MYFTLIRSVLVLFTACCNDYIVAVSIDTSLVVVICYSLCLTNLYVELLLHNIAHVTCDAEIAGFRFACFHSVYVICQFNSNYTGADNEQ